MEKHLLIGNRVKGKGDTWKLVEYADIEYPSLTDTLEAYVTKTKNKGDFILSPLKGAIFLIVNEDDPIPPPKKFNIYGEY